MTSGKVFVGSLAGKEDVFNAAAKKYGLDPALLMAIAMHETGKGTSTMVAERNNPGGLFDSNANDYYRFASVDEGIDAMAKNLKEKYIDQGLTTIEAIQTKYAPVGAANDPRGLNKDWVPGVTSFYKQITGRQPQEQQKGIVKLDERSVGQIATLQSTVQTMATDFLTRAKAWAQSKGLDVIVTEGLRSLERQQELYAQGRTKPGDIVTNAKPGQSNHGSGRAFDVIITKNGKAVDQKSLWNELGAIGKSVGLRWGGDFKSIYDPEHFEFAG
jgi:LAS superfamily LD-carboxypeptidase LdcB